ncbi:MAG TPA: SCO family protein [Acidimicrobiales bacterium]|nr:SCO family protein [Acidimicrobiales bacterium]
MSSGLSTNNPAIVSAFQSALLNQGLIVLLILALVAVAWNVLRSAQYRRARALAAEAPVLPLVPSRPEPAARRLLRVSFGLIWVLDGILQCQISMPLGLGSQVVQPAAAGSPAWVEHLVSAGTTIWDYHPVIAAAAAVWAQVGIGLWLLAAARGNWSRLAGVASVGWGLVVWALGEAFGGIFAPGLSWQFGAPGAVLFYCVAGALVALPEGAWRGPLLGKAVLRTMGAFFVGMAFLQAWPGRGFWQGQPRPGATPGQLVGMVQQMAQTAQPSILSGWVDAFGRFDAAHGWAVNLFVVIALAAIGSAFVTARPRLVRTAVVAGVVVCLADWVLVEDFGFFGGIGTDPNSMVPMALVFVAGYLALTRGPIATAGANVVPISPNTGNWWEKLTADPAYAFRSAAAVGAMGVTLLGAVPMAVAATVSRADPVLAEAVDGGPQSVDAVAPAFNLIDQAGRSVTLASFRGKVIALTFLDDTCTTDCPVIASEFRAADSYLGANTRRQVEMLAINANPRYITPDYLAAFDQQEGLERVPNWLYLTGSLADLRRVWKSYGEEVIYLPAGAMIGHSEYAWVIDSSGHTRDILDTDPGPATSASKSSFSVMLASTIRSVLDK